MSKAKSKAKKEKFIEILRHSCAHILAQAVLEWFPEAKLGIGPVIADGFYYDFELPRTLVPEDLPILEKKMKEVIKKNYSFEKKLLETKKAIKFYKKLNQPYKVELIRDLEKEGAKRVSLYKDGDFVDLCRGPHLDSTGEINPKAFKLTKIAGAYWKGDEKNPMLQRIYGVAFETEKELKEYLKKQEELEKSDHRELNKVLDFYSINKEVGAGLILWHPNGALVKNLIEDFEKEEHKKRGYQYVSTPHIGHLSLWKKSGHWDFYRENMYSPMEVDKVSYVLKPMNCPFHVQIYKSQMRSYKDLPIRFFELGTVYRYERPGTLHGLLRVRGFTQDDAHIFCRPDQLQKELEKVVDFAIFMLKSFGFKEFNVELSLRDPKKKKKYLGSDSAWKQAESCLEKAVKAKKLKYKKALGEAVFYGPKLDFKLIDSLGRFWQGPTIQVDFNFPEKFDLNFINKKGKKERIVMIHRALLGSMERFIGNLIEHYRGAFPVWLAPIQVKVIPVSEKYEKEVEKIVARFKKENLRVDFDKRSESVNKKISDSIKEKIPYTIVFGKREIKSKTLPVRVRGKKKLLKISLDKFVEKIKKEIREKRV